MERVAARIYENIFGLLLPILFLLSLFMTYHAGMTLLGRYQGKEHRKGASITSSDLGIAHPERSFFHNNERFDVLAVYDGRTAAGREVMVRQSSTGQVKTYRIGDRLVERGPFVAAIEKDRVFFWMDGRTKKIPLTP